MVSCSLNPGPHAAPPEMSRLFSSQTRFGTWRQLWLNLAIAEKELGLPIPDRAIEEMRQHLVRPCIIVNSHSSPWSDLLGCR